MSTITIEIRKLGTTYDFTPESLPAVSLEYALKYGLEQSVNDTHSAVKRADFKTDEEFTAAVWAKMQKRIDQILSGNVPTARVADPAAVAARQMAKEMADDAELRAEVEAAMARAKARKAEAQAPKAIKKAA